MSTDELPPLPPRDFQHCYETGVGFDCEDVWGEQAIRAYALAARADLEADIARLRADNKTQSSIIDDLEERLEIKEGEPDGIEKRDAEIERLTGRYDAALELVNNIDGERNKLLEQLAQRDERIRDVLIGLAACNKRAEAAEARVQELEEQIALRDKALNARSIDKFNAVKRVEELERDYGLLRELASDFELERNALRAQIEAIRKQPTVSIGVVRIKEDGAIPVELIERPELP